MFTVINYQHSKQHTSGHFYSCNVRGEGETKEKKTKFTRVKFLTLSFIVFCYIFYRFIVKRLRPLFVGVVTRYTNHFD